MGETRLKYQRAMEAFKDIHATLSTYETAITSFATIVEPKGNRCGACRWTIDQTGEWQFCPYCGQRFRDRWQEMADAEKEKCKEE